MAFHQKPPENKTAIRKAGRNIANEDALEADFDLVDRWRSSHSYVINTFQIWLRRKIIASGLRAEFAQRLKRRNTVIDKLGRKDENGKLLIEDVVSMNDFAGCRIIFENIEDLNKFRVFMRSNKVTKNVKHTLKYEDTKYDYIENPRKSGYRGVHVVYKHMPRGAKRKEARKPWDGLLVEVQYRTKAQHAWATAVEISDLIDRENTKFSLKNTERGDFFAIASELIARKHEGLNKAFLDKSTNELEEMLQIIEYELEILRRLSVIKKFDGQKKLRKHSVLHIFYNKKNNLELDILTFPNSKKAIEAATELEKDEKTANAVYVHSSNPKQLRSAYRNYFRDTVDFVKLVKQ